MKSLHETPRERLCRVYQPIGSDGDVEHPILKGVGLLLLVFGILTVGALAASLVVDLVGNYGEWIRDAATGL